jgi:transcriptional regulatory protein AMDR
VALSLEIAENGLFRFFKDGISPASWSVFDDQDQMRVVYVGTNISNMSHLIQLDRPSPSFLIYPYPQIRPLPSASQSNVHDALQDINSFPAKEIRDEFIDAFFAKINPYFPVVDETDFRARYGNPESRPSLLLLHGILLAGAHVTSHPRAIQARHFIKAVLFRRAKSVFDMRHETDRVNLVQAALLFTWYLQNGDTASANSYFWLGVGCRIAFGIGMHRNVLTDPPGPDRMPLSDRRCWRRVWWTLFTTEVLSALEHGRPCMIRHDDFDQAPLTMEDFREVDGEINPRIDVEYCMRNIELCHIALEVIGLSAPRADPSSMDKCIAPLHARLATWILTVKTGTGFSALNLRLHYHTIVIHLSRILTADEESRQVATSATRAIISIFESLQTNNLISRCHFTAATALTAAAIQIAKEIQRALTTASPIVVVNDLDLLNRVCVVAGHLSTYWPTVEGVRKVFQGLVDRFSAVLGAHEDVPIDMEYVNWADILGDDAWRESDEMNRWESFFGQRI